MAYTPVSGILCSVASWASPNNAILALCAANEFMVKASSNGDDVTPFLVGASGAQHKRFITGCRAWTGMYAGTLAAPTPGHIATMSGSGFYTIGSHSFDIVFSCDEVEATNYQPTGDWMNYIPGGIGTDATVEVWFSSEIGANQDPTTILPTLYNAPVALTFTLTAGNTISIPMFITEFEITARIGNAVLVRFTLKGTSTTSGTTYATGPVIVGSANIFPATAVTAWTTPTATSIVFKPYDTAGTDRTLSGSAFWTSVRVKAAVNSPTTVNVEVRGTGELTPV